MTGKHFGASVFPHYISAWQSASALRTLAGGSGRRHIHISFHGWRTEAALESFLPTDGWSETASLSAYNVREKAPRHGEVNIPMQRKMPAGNTTAC